MAVCSICLRHWVLSIRATHVLAIMPYVLTLMHVAKKELVSITGSPRVAFVAMDLRHRIVPKVDCSWSIFNEELKFIDVAGAWLCFFFSLSNTFLVFEAVTFSDGTYVKFEVSEKFRRQQLLPSGSSNDIRQRRSLDRQQQSMSINFKTRSPDGVLLYTASGKDFSSLIVSL